MRTATITVNGETLEATPAGALFWPARDALIVADLHFEKGSAFAERGVLLPPYDTRATLKRLAALCHALKPKQVISLGDAFHDANAECRMDEEDAAMLDGLMREANWLWILGNHDAEPPARFEARCEIEIRLGGLIFRHEPHERAAPGEIAGHLHPCARVVIEGRKLRRRCFAVGSDRLVMPALGAYTGGLNILYSAFAALFADPIAWVMGADGVYPIPQEKLAPDVIGGALNRAV